MTNALKCKTKKSTPSPVSQPNWKITVCDVKSIYLTHKHDHSFYCPGTSASIKREEVS
jgi:hypothetical protein